MKQDITDINEKRGIIMATKRKGYRSPELDAAIKASMAQKRKEQRALLKQQIATTNRKTYKGR